MRSGNQEVTSSEEVWQQEEWQEKCPSGRKSENPENPENPEPVFNNLLEVGKNNNTLTK